MDLKSGYPFWAVKNGLMHAFPQLREDARCDVAVVGGGITGALIADELTRHGHHVVVVEQRDIGWGSTAASTALIQYEIDTHMVDLAKQRLRSLLEATVLDAGQQSTHHHFGAHKTRAIGAMTGTIVELGPGTGTNVRYYQPNVHVIGIEPNPTMHVRLRARAAAANVHLDILTLRGESVDLADRTADGVVGTLVLCGVDDQAAVLREVKRMLGENDG